MRTAKLLNLGTMLLALGVGAPALAEDPLPVEPEIAAPIEASEPVVAPAEVPVEPVPVAEPVAAAEPVEMEPAALEGVEAELVEAEEPWAAEGVAEAQDAAAAEEPLAADDGEVEPTVAEVPVELGAVGYDSQGQPGRIHVVRVGDTLWDISDAYLGTPWVWPSIWQDNQDIRNPHLIYPGDHIWITPSEMRKISQAEAEALLAGEPAAADPEVEEKAPMIVVDEPVVLQESPTVLLSDREFVGFVTEETLDASGSVLENTTPQLLISQMDRIWVGVGQHEVSEGDRFTVYRVQEKVFDPETKRMLGHHVNILGWVEIVNVSEESSLALVRSSALDIMIGDRLMPRQTPVREIEIVSAPPDVEGQISFLAHKRTHMGTLDYVYLNRGTLDGIEVGTPLKVYRPGFRKRDEARQETLDIPDRAIADLLVVRVQPEVAVALIRHTEGDLGVGDRFRSQLP